MTEKKVLHGEKDMIEARKKSVILQKKRLKRRYNHAPTQKKVTKSKK